MVKLVSSQSQEVMMMVEITVDMDTSALMDKLSPDKAIQVQSKVVNLAAQDLVRNLMINSPVDHGLLKSWFIESIDDSEAHIKTPAEYATYVNYGTGPHMIYPSNAQALYWDGADHPVKWVVHPGTTATLFVENSIEDTQQSMDEFFLTALQEVLG